MSAYHHSTSSSRSFIFFSASTGAQWHGGSRTRLVHSDKSHRRCRPKNAHRLDEQQRATTHYAMANNPQHRQIENGSSCDWGSCQDNRTVKNIFVLITASHTSILLVATLTGTSLAPVAATSISFTIRVWRWKSRQYRIWPCQTVG